MSSKSTIFLTNDNEHCYIDGSDPVFEDGHNKGYPIILEISKKNIDVVSNDEEDLIISIKPGSELYDRLRKMNNK